MEAYPNWSKKKTAGLLKKCQPSFLLNHAAYSTFGDSASSHFPKWKYSTEGISPSIQPTGAANQMPYQPNRKESRMAVSYTHLRAHET